MATTKTKRVEEDIEKKIENGERQTDRYATTAK